MTLQEILNAAQKQFPQMKLEVQKGDAGDEWLLVAAADLSSLMQFFHRDLGMDFLACLSAADLQTHFAVVYQIRSLKDKSEMMVKVLLDHDKPQVATVSTLWANAGWFEREAYDLFGIHFSGHADLRRIMMPDDWVGHPLRRDYQEQPEYHGISTSRPDSHRVLDPLYPKKAETGAAEKAE